MANYAQTVNVIGCIKTTKTDAAFATTGLVLKLYRERFGSLPVQLSGDLEPLDACAALTEDRKNLTIAVVNPLAETVDIPVEFSGIDISGKGRVWTITGPDAMAYNEPGGQNPVTLEGRSVGNASEGLSVPPLSVSVFILNAAVN